MSEEPTLAVGEIVQLNPEKCRNQMFSGCLMTISELKAFGAQGYVQVPGPGPNGEPGGQAYYRANWEEMERTGGMAPFLAA